VNISSMYRFICKTKRPSLGWICCLDDSLYTVLNKCEVL
jgi:hypothetical protein